MELKDNCLHLGIVTHNGNAMLNFYQCILGLERVGEVRFPGLGVVNKLQCGDSQIKLLVLDNSAAAENPGGGFSAATGFRYCSMTICNIEEIVSRCKTAGCHIVLGVKELRPGVKAAMIEDPDGNSIEFMEVDH